MFSISHSPWKSVVMLIVVLCATVLSGASAMGANLDWTAKASLPVPASRAASAVVNGKMFVLGGDTNTGPASAVKAYDPLMDSWQAMPPLSESRFAGADAQKDGIVYIAGGSSSGPIPTSSILSYDTATGGSYTIGYLFTPRMRASAAILNNRMYVVGGSNNDGTVYDTIEEFDLTTHVSVTKATMPVPLESAAVVEAQGRIYIIGGFGANGLPVNSTWQYNPDTNEFVAKNPVPVPVGARALVAPDGKIYLIGGMTNYNNPMTWTTAIQVYDPQTDSWQQMGSFPTSRYAPAAGILNNSLYVIGGDRDMGPGSGNLDVNESALLSIGDPLWSTAVSMATARAGYTATLLPSGKVLVAGGYGNGYQSSAELYDPATNSWSSAGSMANARGFHSATLLSNGTVLVAGGFYFNGTYYYLSSAELYDPVSNSWSSVGSMAIERNRQTATLLSDGKVLVAGGYDQNNNILSSAELYNPVGNSWSTASAMETARSYHTATLLPNGKVLVAGGYNNNDAILSRVELYDPTSNSWSTADYMTTPRQNHTATLLANGKVLVAGGYGNGTLSSVELFDPAGNSWSTTGSMATARQNHTATLLTNGKVLVAGGYGIGTLSSAELYDLADNNWNTTGSMATARQSHTATLLTNGKVLVAGGEYINNAIPGYLSSAELYGPAGGGGGTPSAVIVQPINGTVINGIPSPITGSVALNGAPTVTSVTVSINGGGYNLAIDTSGNGSWTSWQFPWTAESGTNTISAIACSNAGTICQNVPTTSTVTVNMTGAPYSSITAPAYGASLSGARYTITGTSSPNGGPEVQRVDVSTDGGASWVQATPSTSTYQEGYYDINWNWVYRTVTVTSWNSWSYNWLLPLNGNYTILSRATNYSYMSEMPGMGVNVTVNHLPPPSPGGPGSVYVSSMANSTLSVIDASTNAIKATINLGETSMFAAANSAGTRVYLSTGNGVSVVDTSSNTVIATIGIGSHAMGIAAKPDGTRVYAASWGYDPITYTSRGNVSVINTLSNEVIANIPLESYGSGNIVISPDGARLYIDKFVIDTSTNRIIATLPVQSGNCCVLLNQNGTRLYLTYMGGNPNVTVVDTSSYQVVANISIPKGACFISFNSSGTRAYVTSSNSPGYVTVIDTYTYSIIAEIPVGSFPSDIGINSDGTRVYTATSDGLEVIDTFSNSVIAAIPVGSAFGVLFVPVGGTPPPTGAKLFGWGANSYGQLGDGTTTDKYSPVSITLPDVTAIAAGFSHTLFKKADNTLWAAGSNSNGQLGFGSSDYNPHPIPQQITGIDNVKAIAGGASISLAAKVDGTVWEWGSIWIDDSMGMYYTINQPNPMQKNGLSGINAVAASTEPGGADSHNLALKSDGTVWSWGSNGYGQLGRTGNPVVPGQVEGLTDVVKIAAGIGFSVAVKSDGSVWTWGRNDQGQLGWGTLDYNFHDIPVQVPNLSGIIEVDAGYDYIITLKSGGTVWSWGGNSVGQLGNGTTIPSTVPVQAIGIDGVIAIAEIRMDSIAVKADGTIWVWGCNHAGELGNGVSDWYPHPYPTVVNGLSGITAASGGGGQVLAISSGTGCIPSIDAGPPQVINATGFPVYVTLNATIQTCGQPYLCQWHDGLGNFFATSCSVPVAFYQAGTFHPYVTIWGAPGLIQDSTEITILAPTPLSSINSPLNGATISGAGFTITGTSSPNGGPDVQRVDVSTDGGANWVQAVPATSTYQEQYWDEAMMMWMYRTVTVTNWTSWSYNWPLPYSGSFTILSRATNYSSISEMPGMGVNVTVNNAPPGAAGRLYVTGNTVSVIDASTNIKITTIDTGGYSAFAAANSAGTRVYLATGNGVAVVDTSTNTVINRIRAGTNFTGIAVKPDGTRVYATYLNYNPIGNRYTGTVSVIDTSLNTVITTIPLADGVGMGNIEISPDGARLYVGRSVIGTSSNTVIATLPVDPNICCVHLNKDGTRLYITYMGGSNLVVADTSTYLVVATLPVPSGACCVAFNPSGTRAYITSSSSVTVIDTASYAVIAVIPLSSFPNGIGINSDGTRVYVTIMGNDPSTGTFSVIDAATNTVIATMPGVSAGMDVLFVPVGGSGGGWTVNSVLQGDPSSIDWAVSQHSMVPWGSYLQINGVIYYVSTSVFDSWNGINYTSAQLQLCNQTTGTPLYDSYGQPLRPDMRGSSGAAISLYTFGTLDVTPPIVLPTIPGGTYSTPFVGVILTTNEPATIYYTTNGLAPTTASPEYSALIYISSTTNLMYFARDMAGNSSNIESQYYTFGTLDITPPIVLTPTPGGNFLSPVSVVLTANEPATIYYTTNGWSPTTASPVYSAPIYISSTTNLMYFGRDMANNSSNITSQYYTFGPPSITYNLSVSINGSGSGFVTSTPSGISCGSDCTENYPINTVVSLTAMPDDAGSTFAGWSGGPDCLVGQVTMNSNKTCTATFNSKITYPLSVTINGSGFVYSSPPPLIYCSSGTCTESYESGTSVILTADPPYGWKFTGWTGCDGGNGNVCVVTMNAAKSFTATFNPIPLISVSPVTHYYGPVPVGSSSAAQSFIISNTGAANLSVGPISITGTDYNLFSLAPGSCGSLSPTIAPGGSCSIDVAFAPTATGDRSAALHIVSNANVNPTFDLSLTGSGFIPMYQLSITLDSDGSGTAVVQTPPPGTTCSSSCSQTYLAGTAVTVAAVSSLDYIYTGWSGCDIVVGPVCYVSMNSAKTVTPSFAPSVTKPVQPSPDKPVLVNPTPDVSLTLTPTNDGEVTVAASAGNFELTGALEIAGTRHEISTTAAYNPPITVCIGYNPANVSGDEQKLRLYHLENQVWVDITTQVLTGAAEKKVCGVTNSLSPFVVGLDTTPPVTIPPLPPPPNNPCATFTFTATETGSTFQCKLDSGDWASCTSPKTYCDLADGSHTFSVMATDKAGNIELTPGIYVWTVDTTPPETTITSQPTSPTNINSASFTFTTSEPGSTFQCKLDNSTWTACTSPITYNTLNDGSHIFNVKATDHATNTDPTPVIYSWIVDTIAPVISGKTTASPNGAVWFNSSVTVQFSASDSGSGVQTVTTDMLLSEEGSSQTATGTATDNANNNSSYTVNGINIDKTAPTSSATLSGTMGDTGTTYRSSIQVSLTASDNLSGVKLIEYRLNGDGWTTYTAPFTIATDGSTKVEYHAVDKADNSELVKTTTVTIDKTAPTSSGTDPSNKAINVALDKTIVITFSESVKPGSTYSGIVLKTSKSIVVPVTTSISADGFKLLIKPTAALFKNSTYTLTVPAGAVNDSVGNQLAASNALNFTTVKK